MMATNPNLPEMCGIILAGGKGTRLYPITKAVSKSLLPVYDKPMIYYPLSLMMKMHVRDIAIITTKEALPQYQMLLGSGKQFGVRFTYFIQKKPDGIAQSFKICKDFIGNRRVCLMLGDNIFYGGNLDTAIRKSLERSAVANIFAIKVNNPSAYGVLRSNPKDDQGFRINEVIEKPETPPTSYAVPGLYIFPSDVVSAVKKLKKSARGEYEITDLNNMYLKKRMMCICPLTDETIWLDGGTPESLNDASNIVRSIQERSGKNIADLHQIAVENGWIKE